MRTVRSFAVLGALVFGVFGLFTAIGSVVATKAPPTVAVQFLVIFVAIGLFSGLFMGWVKGRSDADNDIQRFRDLFQQGSVVVTVASDKYARAVVGKMRQEKALLISVDRRVRPLTLYAASGELAPAHG